ncbi:hypothetical protein Pmani_024847 [Petrolisthes manimaculis]|uniref:Uncharacterized protein n=1 Tax=Petrolisthes manimaculis TaxID=1843537 RepID=A0AAE1P7D3_9EUCA|nr:hypothetical protein Pmani_024847 [Petrolisthes manimaculis]
MVCQFVKDNILTDGDEAQDVYQHKGRWLVGMDVGEAVFVTAVLYGVNSRTTTSAWIHLLVNTAAAPCVLAAGPAYLHFRPHSRKLGIEP